jgi:hypothetical protein
MVQIIGKLFKCPASLSGPVGEVMTQVVEGNIANQLPLLSGRLRFNATEPVMNPSFGQPLVTLGGEDIRTFRIAPSVLKVVAQGVTCLVEQVDLTKLASLVSDTEPADLGTYIRVVYQEMAQIAHAAPGPVAQREEGSASYVVIPVYERTKDIALL